MINTVFTAAAVLIIGYLITATSPVGASIVAAGAIITRGQGHVANWFIQLEVISLLLVYLVYVERVNAGLAPFTAIIVFTALASEGAIGLAVIVKNSRGARTELLKSRF